MVEFEEGLTVFADLYLLLSKELRHLLKVVYSLLTLFASPRVENGLNRSHDSVGRMSRSGRPDRDPARRLSGFLRLAALHAQHGQQSQGHEHKAEQPQPAIFTSQSIHQQPAQRRAKYGCQLG